MTLESTVPPRPDKPELPAGVPEMYTITCKSRHVTLGVFYSMDDAIVACKQAHEMLGCQFAPVPFIIVHGARLVDEEEEPRTDYRRDYGERDYRGGQYL